MNVRYEPHAYYEQKAEQTEERSGQHTQSDSAFSIAKEARKEAFKNDADKMNVHHKKRMTERACLRICWEYWRGFAIYLITK